MLSLAKALSVLPPTTRTVQREPTIVVWGHYHGRNLGDELVVATVIAAIRRRLPGARVVGVSMSPGDTRKRHGIDAYPINPVRLRARPATPVSSGDIHRGRWSSAAWSLPGTRHASAIAARVRALVLEPGFLWRSYRMLRSVDLVVVAGSGQLLDEWRGPWLHPYTIFRWAMLARLARVPMLYPSVGAGPIENALSAFFIRRAVAAADYISVRDAHSGRTLASIGLPGPFSICPDMGYGLSDDVLRDAVTASGEHATGTIVGLNVMAHQDPRYWPRGARARFEAFLQKMMAFAEWLLENGYTVRLFSSQARSDRRVADDLASMLAENRELDRERLSSAMEQIDEVDDLVRVIAGCDLVVAARYHSVLLPLLLDIPVLGLSYNPKTSELLAAVGQPERCLDIDSFTVDSLVTAFRSLCRPEPPEAGKARRARVVAHRAAVEEQFERIFGPASTERSADDVAVVT